MDKVSTNFFVQAWHSLLYGGASGNSRTSQAQAYVTNVYMLLALLMLTVFGVLNILESNTWVGQLELAGGAAILLNVVGFHLSRNRAMAQTWLLLTIMVMLLVMLLTGGTQGTGIFWFFVFPVVAFFLVGKKQGLWWMAALYTMLTGVLLLEWVSVLQIPYALITIRQLLISLGVVALGVYVYQGAREAARSETMKLDRAKSEFLALVSHQLRTPISAISWFAEMLLNGDAGTITAEQKKNIEQIYDSNKRMAVLISDMLAVSSLDLGTLPVKPVKSDLADASRAVLADMKQGLLVNRTLDIEESYAADLPKIKVDPDVMRTILHNLFSNAIKYSPDKSKITIRIHHTEEKVRRTSQGSVQIDVEDTGYGISRAAQAKLFSKFFRAKNIQVKDTDGTGLGLYVVKNLLDYVGGAIRFTSKEGVGSTFTVLLPLEGMQKDEEVRSKDA